MKDFLYVGHYIDTDGNYILKIGTTNDLETRQSQHTRYYAKAKNHPMAEGTQFAFDWYLPLSRANTHRYEESIKDLWISQAFGTHIRNDRFCFTAKPDKVYITIRKTYEVALQKNPQRYFYTVGVYFYSAGRPRPWATRPLKRERFGKILLNLATFLFGSYFS